MLLRIYIFHSKNYIPRKDKTTNNLSRREDVTSHCQGNGQQMSLGQHVIFHVVDIRLSNKRKEHYKSCETFGLPSYLI
jgi:hypothetical protein